PWLRCGGGERFVVNQSSRHHARNHGWLRYRIPVNLHGDSQHTFRYHYACGIVETMNVEDFAQQQKNSETFCAFRHR
ncbi:MAG TPA: hypothetical protein VFZ34_30935, partial [Blastocatellia bacterium]|nr:hypothetical protein [Blastocatellia bacterium]